MTKLMERPRDIAVATARRAPRPSLTRRGLAAATIAGSATWAMFGLGAAPTPAFACNAIATSYGNSTFVPGKGSKFYNFGRSGNCSVYENEEQDLSGTGPVCMNVFNSGTLAAYLSGSGIYHTYCGASHSAAGMWYTRHSNEVAQIWNDGSANEHLWGYVDTYTT